MSKNRELFWIFQDGESLYMYVCMHYKVNNLCTIKLTTECHHTRTGCATPDYLRKKGRDVSV